MTGDDCLLCEMLEQKEMRIYYKIPKISDIVKIISKKIDNY